MFAKVVFLFIAVFLFQSRWGFAFKISISPNPVTRLVQNRVTMSCHLDQADDDVREISYINLLKGDTPVVVFRLDSSVHVTEGMENLFQAHGKLVTPIRESYLQVTMSNPSIEDSGEFRCVLYYLDNARTLKEKSKTANLTVSVTNLEQILTDQKAEIEDLKKAIESRDEKVTSLEHTVTSLGQTVTDLVIENREEKESVVSAFRAEYDSNDKIAYGKTLIFRTIRLNIGDNFDNTTGMYTAPTRGLYVIALYVLRYYPNTWITVSIRVNDNTDLATLYGRGKDNDGQTSSVKMRRMCLCLVSLVLFQWMVQQGSSEPAQYTCPPGYTLFDRDNKCLIAHETSRHTMEEATAICCNKCNGKIVEIKDQTKQAFVKNMKLENTQYWIGMKRVHEFYNADNGNQMVDGLYWLSAQPNNWGNYQGCVEMTSSRDNSKLNDERCRNSHGYICQMDATGDLKKPSNDSWIGYIRLYSFKHLSGTPVMRMTTKKPLNF